MNIAKSFPSNSILLLTSLQAVAVHIYLGRSICICEVYLLLKDPGDQHTLEGLVYQLPTPLILVGDLNVHSIIPWGSEHSNTQGEQIEKLISYSNLCLLNNGEVTHFHEPTQYFHAVHLAICSPTLLSFLKFFVGSDHRNSNHLPLSPWLVLWIPKKCKPWWNKVAKK